MSAFCTVYLPPLANVPAKCMQRTFAFAAVRGDKTVMRPFAKLLWTVVIIIIIVIIIYYSRQHSRRRG